VMLLACLARLETVIAKMHEVQRPYDIDRYLLR